jgi:nitroreductase
MTAQDPRKPQHPVDPLFLNRWSPRAMSGEEIPPETLMSLFEAAKWAPSSNNNQPWRFLYARRESRHWPVFFDLLNDLNRAWTKNAAVLIVVISKQTFDQNEKPSRTHSFDCGAAWENLALQGSIKGLVVHGMQGFDYDKARLVLNVPDIFTVEAMIAIGKPGRKDDLPPNLQEREFPSPRKTLAEIVVEGPFQF